MQNRNCILADCQHPALQRTLKKYALELGEPLGGQKVDCRELKSEENYPLILTG